MQGRDDPIRSEHDPDAALPHGSRPAARAEGDAVAGGCAWGVAGKEVGMRRDVPGYPAVVGGLGGDIREVALTQQFGGEARLLIGEAGGLEVIVFDALVSPDVLALASPTAELNDVGKRPGSGVHQAVTNATRIELVRAGRRVVRLKAGGPFVSGR